MVTITGYLQRTQLFAWALVALSFLGTIPWMLDRTPPLDMGSTTAYSNAADNRVTVVAEVHRDISRGCSLEYTRYAVDSKGLRYNITPTTYMSAAALNMLEQVEPGKLRTSFIMPSYASPGPAKLITSLRYKCNPLHTLFPIEFATLIDFEVMK